MPLRSSRKRSEPLRAPESLTADLRRKALHLQRESPAPSVSIALFRGADLLWSDAIGLADVEGGREATTDTQYAIASITKTFVAASIFALRDEEKLGLDDPIGRHLAQAAESEEVTIRRLLAHSSGIQREVPGNVWETLEFPDREQLLGSLDEAEQVLRPGDRWHYSNLAYALLGELIGQLSGTDAKDFIRERFLEPLGLTRTTWGPGENAATGYFVDPFADVAHAEPVVEKKAVSPAGALWSTTGDLARWGAHLMEQEEMHAVQVMTDPGWTLAWGLGLMLHRRGERLFAGHDGGTVGHASHLSYARREKAGVAVLTNTGNPLTEFDFVALADTAANALPAEEEPWRPGQSPPAELEGVLGPWWGEGVEWVFEWRDGRLAVRRPGTRPPVPTTFEREKDDRYRTVSGREQGELLLIHRDADRIPSKLSWATYAFTRRPRAFGAHTPIR
jgi:CubicO group peptidase (beta-lactamase class C family)